jgi:L-fuculose-phosphate aldolase
METMEHFARIALVAELLGGAKVLPRNEVDKLLDARTRYGVKARNAGEPGCPLSAEDVAGGASQCGGEERYYVTRAELIALVDEAVKARGA